MFKKLLQTIAKVFVARKVEEGAKAAASAVIKKKLKSALVFGLCTLLFAAVSFFLGKYYDDVKAYTYGEPVPEKYEGTIIGKLWAAKP
ncbi:MAG: hypothetical protein K6G66_02495 [Oscillospiraceae bacterium]|nr:hypothetical protein [Oscillospiraceae bacterium]